MKIYDTPGNHKIFFSAPKNTEGLTDVKLTLFKHDGTVLLNEVSMSELGDGVYQYTFNFPVSGWYISVCHSISLGGNRTDSFRIGSPTNDYIYGITTSDSTNVYEINQLDDTNVETGMMIQIGSTGVFFVDITSLPFGSYFFKMNHKDTARFDYPFKKGTIVASKLVLEQGYNIAAFPGTGNYTFDSSAGVWVYISSNVENTKANDIWKYIHYFYPTVTARYIKSYYEWPTERFKIFVPEVTPTTNDNNFPLIQINQVLSPEQNAFYILLDCTGYVVIDCK